MRRRLAAACLSALLLTATACGSGDDSGDGSTDGTTSRSSGSIDGLTVTGDFGKEPTVEVDGMDVDAAESEVLVEGDGQRLDDGSAALYRFVIANGDTGKNVASNYQDNDPQRMVVSDQPAAIKDAITGQRIGSRVAVAMPVEDLLGEQGAPQVGLEAGGDLVLVFDLLEAAQAPLDGPQGKEVKPPADAPTVVEKDGEVTGLDFSSAPANPPKKLQVIPLVNGDGTPVKEGDTVTVDYLGAVWGKGDQPFDQSYSSAPATFTLAEGSLIDGWVQGLQGVRAGSRVMLVVPPKLGYGAEGSGDQIPPDSTLVFVVDVLGVNL